MHKLKNRKLPGYSRGEEIANMVTHVVGAAFALVSLFLCVIVGAWKHNVLGIVSGMIYGVSMMVVYTISSVYHGLDERSAFIGKRVMQVIDHCDIYGLIMGTFSPIVLCGLIQNRPALAWTSYGIVLLTSVVGIVFTAIDFHKFRIISYAMYFVSGWSVLMTVKAMYEIFGLLFVVLLVSGGVVYTLGMIFFVLEVKHHRYCHSIFHVFILGGSVLQFITIFRACYLGL